MGSAITNQILQGLANGVSSYGGDRVAPLIDEFAAVREFLGETDLGINPLVDSSLDELLSGRPSFDLSPDITEAYFNNAVAAPLFREFDKSVAPRIREAFAAGGASFSSQRGHAEADALGDIQVRLAAELASIQQQNQYLNAQLHESAKGRQQTAVNQSLQASQQPFLNAQLMQQALGIYQQQEQAQLDAEFEDYLRTSAQNNPWIQYGLGFTGQQQTYVSQEDTALGTGIKIAGAGANIFSALNPAPLFGG